VGGVLIIQTFWCLVVMGVAPLLQGHGR
jgi:hypothetical protein